jgi:hypothetical protein
MSLYPPIDVLVASGFSTAAIIRPQVLVPVESGRTPASLLLAMYAAAPRIPLALLVLGAIYKQATPALLILGALAGAMQLLDAAALSRRPTILRGVSASQIRADHPVNQARIPNSFFPLHNSVWVPHVRTSVRGLIKTGRSPIKALTTFPQSRSWVPHISLVFGEMWDSTALSPKIFPAKCA